MSAKNDEKKVDPKASEIEVKFGEASKSDVASKDSKAAVKPDKTTDSNDFKMADSKQLKVENKVGEQGTASGKDSKAEDSKGEKGAGKTDEHDKSEKDSKPAGKPGEFSKADKEPKTSKHSKTGKKDTKQSKTAKDPSSMQEDDEMVQEWKNAFTALDKKGDGSIAFGDLGELLRSLGVNLTELELSKMLTNVDTNKNGKVELSEFLTFMENTGRQLVSQENSLRKTFKSLDKDNKGFISAAEVHKLFQGMGQNISEVDVLNMIELADMDGDGVISFEEFVTMMTVN